MEGFVINYAVIICTYNGSKYIEQQLSSILSQSVAPSFILISDDGSFDDTICKVRNLFELYDFNSFEIICAQGMGAAQNFLYAIDRYRNDFDALFFSDQDDVWLCDKAKVQLQAMNNKADSNNTRAVGVFTDSIVVDENLNIISDSFLNYQGIDVKIVSDDSIYYKNCIQGATLALNKNAVDLIKSSLNVVKWSDIYMHDWYIAIILKNHGDIEFVSDGLILYRQHGSNVIGAVRKNYIYRCFYFRKYMKSCWDVLTQKNAYRACSRVFGEQYQYKKHQEIIALIIGRNIKFVPFLKRLVLAILKTLHN
ncbi:MAG: glycosyltransferase [Shewanella sp.]